LERDNIERFRQKLKNLLQVLEDSECTASAETVVRSIRNDFDLIFPAEVWTDDYRKVLELVQKYCCNNIKQCPICKATLQQRVSRAGRPFLGCPKYPLCKGSRSASGQPTINDALREFVSHKYEKDLIEQQKKQSNRFRNLEL